MNDLVINSLLLRDPESYKREKEEKKKGGYSGCLNGLPVREEENQKALQEF